MQKKIYFLLFILISFLVAFAFIPSIPQWQSYHSFADIRTIFSIPNFNNVVSNILFLIVSFLGFKTLQKEWHNKNLNNPEKLVFCILFWGIFLIGISSAYYHWAPNNF